MRVAAILAVAALSVASPSALAEVDYGLLARKSLAAFACAEIAAFAKSQKEVERLFAVGLGAAREYVAEARAGKLNDHNNRQAPVGVLWSLEGPTVDFVVGRIYEVAVREVQDKVKPIGAKADFVLPSQNEYTARETAR